MKHNAKTLENYCFVEKSKKKNCYWTYSFKKIQHPWVIMGANYQTRFAEIFEKLQWEQIETIFKKREQLMSF